MYSTFDLGVKDERLDKAFEWMARTVTGDGILPITEKKNLKDIIAINVDQILYVEQMVNYPVLGEQ